MKKLIGKCLRAVLPWYLYKLIANGFIIVPKYYKGIINDAEQARDLSLQESEGRSMLLLRKYAHIIDKGLHRLDAEAGHSKSYYDALVSELKALEGTSYEKDPTYAWVLSKKQAYESLQANPSTFKPLRGIETTSNISYDELLSLMQQRRSNRYFKLKRVSDEIIEKLKVTANWAASSCNKQPIRIFATNEPNLAKECLSCCKGGTGFGEFIPSFWVFTADVRGYVWPTELYLPVVDTCLGVQNVFLAAQTLGISGTILTWAQKESHEELSLRRLLNIPQHYSIVLCAVVGYADFTYCIPTRKSCI